MMKRNPLTLLAAAAALLASAFVFYSSAYNSGYESGKAKADRLWQAEAMSFGHAFWRVADGKTEWTWNRCADECKRPHEAPEYHYIQTNIGNCVNTYGN